MLPAYVKLEKIDEPIRELVIEANQLPFLDTVSVCSSHLDAKPHSRKSTRIAEGIIFSRGWFSFQVDDRYGAVSDFVKAIEQKALAYPFASFSQRKRTENDREKYLKHLGRYSSQYFSVYATGKGLERGNLRNVETRLEQIYEMWRDLAAICKGFR